MKKHMKILTMCLAVVLVLAVGATAMAAELPKQTNVTATEEISDTTAESDEKTTKTSEKETANAAASTEEDSAAPDSSEDHQAKTDGTSEKGTHGANVISVAADVLGMSKDEVRDAVADAKVGDLLIAQGKVDAFKTAYLAATQEKLTAAVSEGSITQEEADESYAKAEEKMANYDGTTHLCGHADHSDMKAKDSVETTNSNTDTQDQAA